MVELPHKKHKHARAILAQAVVIGVPSGVNRARAILAQTVRAPFWREARGRGGRRGEEEQGARSREEGRKEENEPFRDSAEPVCLGGGNRLSQTVSAP